MPTVIGDVRQKKAPVVQNCANFNNWRIDEMERMAVASK